MTSNKIQSDQQEYSPKDASIYLIGAFPPPVHGMSLVNNEIKKKFISLGKQPIVIDLSASSLNRALYLRFFRIKKFLIGLIKFIKTIMFATGLSLYIGVSGGFGQIYDLSFIFIGRLYKKRIFIHHHSYAYLHDKNLITWLLISLAGRKATHIVACEDMEIRLKTLYSSAINIEIISGIITTDRNICPNKRIKKSLKTIGFLSNISVEKGIIEFLDVISRLIKDGTQIKALVAGPFQDEKTEALVMNRVSKLKNTKYVGPKYGIEKTAFYENIDVLLFPTNYENESEGLVIHEAMSYGVPVIAKERGCISNLIPTGTGLLVPKDNDFVQEAVRRIEFWFENVSDFKESSYLSQELFNRMHNLHYSNFDKLLRKML